MCDIERSFGISTNKIDMSKRPYKDIVVDGNYKVIIDGVSVAAFTEASNAMRFAEAYVLTCMKNLGILDIQIFNVREKKQEYHITMG